MRFFFQFSIVWRNPNVMQWIINWNSLSFKPIKNFNMGVWRLYKWWKSFQNLNKFPFFYSIFNKMMKAISLPISVIFGFVLLATAVVKQTDAISCYVCTTSTNSGCDDDPWPSTSSVPTLSGLSVTPKRSCCRDFLFFLLLIFAFTELTSNFVFKKLNNLS